VQLVASLILLAGFLFDASYTLCVRMLTRQRFMEAHRSHLYQQLAASIGHLRTTLGFLVFGLTWLLPLAALSLSFPGLNLVWIGLAIVPLVGLAIWFRAGIPAGGSEVER
jgi:Fuc2NAc and GlcNAc transferase